MVSLTAARIHLHQEQLLSVRFSGDLRRRVTIGDVSRNLRAMMSLRFRMYVKHCFHGIQSDRQMVLMQHASSPAVVDVHGGYEYHFLHMELQTSGKSLAVSVVIYAIRT
jgi:hypothetical protein